MFLSVMIAIGLFVLRMLIARPLVRRVEGASLRAVTIAWCVVAAVSLVAIPVYLDVDTSVDSLRSVFAVGSLVPLFRVTAFGRAYVDLEICMALFCAAGAIALWVDRPQREHRSIAEIFALPGALAAAGSVLLIPGLAGHAAQTAPRGLSLAFDWLHLVSGSIWLGGLVGLLVLWASLPEGRRVAGLSVCVPRFSNVAFVSVLLLLASGIGSTDSPHPGPERAVDDLLRGRDPRQGGAARGGDGCSAQSTSGAPSPGSWPPVSAPSWATRPPGCCAERSAPRRCSWSPPCSPPPRSRASRRRRRRWRSSARHWPPSAPAASPSVVQQDGYTLKALVSPNTPAAPNSFGLEITKNGQPVTNADVTITFEMLDMQMGSEEYQLSETQPGHLHPQRARAGDGRPLGAALLGHSQAGPRVHRPPRGSRRRMSVYARLLASLAALGMGAAALILVILLLHTTIGFP